MNRLVALMISIALLLSGCAWFAPDEAKTYLDTSKEKERVYYHDPDADQQFLEVYNLDALLDHRVYTVKDVLHVELDFPLEVDRANIQYARNYFTQLALLKDMLRTEVPYWYEDLLKTEFSMVHLRIFIDEELYLYEGFDQETSSRIFFENHQMDLPFKVQEDAVIAAFRDKAMDAVPAVVEVRAIKPIKETLLILEVQTDGALTAEQVDLLKGLLAEDLAVAYEKEDKWPYHATMEYLGLVLQIYEQAQLESEWIYFNGLEKRWMEADWKNFDFFRENALLVDQSYKK